VKSSKGPRRLRIPATTVGHGAAHATLDRIDTVVVEADGLVSAQQGTPDANPVAPSLGLGMTPIADVYIAALDTTLVNANITDRRVREPFGEEQLRDGAVTAAKMSKVPVVPDISIGAGDPSPITITAKDVDGNAVARAQLFKIEVLNGTGGFDTGAVTTGTLVQGTLTPTTRTIYVRSNASGVAVVEYTYGSTGNDIYVVVTPMSEANDASEPGYPRFRVQQN
jgi:hypothetical protein